MNKLQIERSSADMMVTTRRAAVKAGLSPADVQELELYIPVYLKSSANSYELRLDGKSAIQEAIKNGAIFLDENDAFVAHGIGLFICKADIIDGKPSIASKDFFAYTPSNVFTAVEVVALKHVYSGTTSIMTDQAERSGKRRNRILYSVPQTQDSATTESSYENLPLYGFDSSHLFLGGVSNRIILNMEGDLTNITPL